MEQGDDCNDGNSAIYPGADEFCDDIDQDCDGESFDPESLNATTWYIDDDEDGFGDASKTTTSCNPVTGYSANDLDCDDSDATVNPDAAEVCDLDDTDEDCSGLADDNDPDVDTGTKDTFYLDDDGDGYGQDSVTELRCDASGGYARSGGDCDDSNALRNPGAPEVCDEDNIDEDCDDLADDSDSDVSSSTFSTYFPDADGDGYGDVDAVGVDQCDPDSTNSADNDSDCDDSDASISPDAAEVCDDADFDENCNGVADDDDSTTTDFTTWYLDADSDDYGDPGTTVDTCELPDGFADNDQDCDDSDGSAFPGATEIWYDGVDSDCDGADDYDADADGYTSADHSGDDCDDEAADTNPGATEICSDNRDNDCDGTSNGCGLAGTLGTSDALAHLSEEDGGDDAGSAVHWVPDLDGDGSDELLVAAPLRDEGGGSSGSVYLVMGPVTGDGSLGSATAEYIGEEGGEEAGLSLGALADGDGAGTPAVLIGGPESDAEGIGSGVAWLVTGSQAGLFDLQNADASLYGEEGDAAGTALSSGGDVDYDGIEDVLVGGLAEDTEGRAGVVWLLHGPVSGNIALDLQADARIVGESSDDRAGEALSSAGDTNGDGYSDLLIGAPREDAGASNAGAAYVWLGPLTGDLDLVDADAKLTGTGGSDLAASVVAHAGDLDDDGYADLAVGAAGNDDAGIGAGAVYLFYGPATTSASLGAADVELLGEAGGDAAGAAISAGGDIDSDGVDDLLIGAWGYTPSSGGTTNGATYLFYGPVSGSGSLGTADVVFVGDDGYTGFAVAGGGDSNADGYDDLLIGTIDSGVWLLAGEGL